MDYIQLSILAVLQGLTEFLPVSSSGHLRLMESLWGLTEPQTLLDVSMHAGTLVAVLLFFRKDVASMLRGLAAFPRLARQRGWREAVDDPGVKLVLLLVLATLPLLPIGLLLGDRMEAAATDLSTLGWFFMLNGVILLLSKHLRFSFLPGRLNKGPHGFRWYDALFIGLAQCVGLFRGVSRSGSTISAGLILGLDRRDAAAFSFLMSVPAILGALVLQLAKAEGGTNLPGTSQLLFAAAVACVVGLLALGLLMRILKTRGFHLFGIYTLLLGLGLVLRGYLK